LTITVVLYSRPEYILDFYFDLNLIKFKQQAPIQKGGELKENCLRHYTKKVVRLKSNRSELLKLPAIMGIVI